MIIPNAVRIEQALSIWENTSFITNILFRYLSRAVTGPLAHWKEFRPYLNEPVVDEQTVTFDWQRFWFERNPLDGKYQPLWDVAQDLFVWARAGRRIFHLKGDWTRLGEIVAQPNLTWAQIPWPLAGCLIILDQPILSATGKVFDCILPTHGFDMRFKTPGIGLHLFCTDLDKQRVLTNDAKSQMRQALDRGQPARFAQLIEGYAEKPGDVYFSRIAFYPEVASSPLTSTIAQLHHNSVRRLINNAERYSARDFPEWDGAAKVILGLFSQLASAHLEWNGLDTSGFLRYGAEPVTAEAQVCVLESPFP